MGEMCVMVRIPLHLNAYNMTNISH